METSKPVILPLCKTLKIRTLAFSPDGKKLAAGGAEPPTVLLIDSSTLAFRHLPIHGGVLGMSWFEYSQHIFLVVLWSTGHLSFFDAENYNERMVTDFPKDIVEKNKQQKGYVVSTPGLVATAAGAFGNIWGIDGDLSEIVNTFNGAGC